MRKLKTSYTNMAFIKCAIYFPSDAIAAKQIGKTNYRQMCTRMCVCVLLFFIWQEKLILLVRRRRRGQSESGHHPEYMKI